MTVSSHLQELKRKHEALDAQVTEAQRAPSTPDADITALKKQKLKLKEEIERLSL